jgi:hypothetical protein
LAHWSALKEQEDGLAMLAGVFDEQATPPPVDDLNQAEAF